MKLSSVLVSTLLAALAVGCAGSTGKQAQTARDEEAPGVRARQQSAANGYVDSPEARAQAERELAEDFGDKPRYQADRERARAKMAEIRETYRGDVTARLERANTRLVDAQAKVDASKGRAPQELKAQIAGAAAERTAVSQQISQLPIIRDDQWDAMTRGLDKRLSSLEAMVDAVVQSSAKL